MIFLRVFGVSLKRGYVISLEIFSFSQNVNRIKIFKNKIFAVASLLWLLTAQLYFFATNFPTKRNYFSYP